MKKYQSIICFESTGYLSDVPESLFAGCDYVSRIDLRQEKTVYGGVKSNAVSVVQTNDTAEE